MASSGAAALRLASAVTIARRCCREARTIRSARGPFAHWGDKELRRSEQVGRAEQKDMGIPLAGFCRSEYLRAGCLGEGPGGPPAALCKIAFRRQLIGRFQFARAQKVEKLFRDAAGDRTALYRQNCGWGP
jgi:hypothetical protein